MRNGLIGKVAGVMCLLLAGASNAATYSVYIDSDNDVSTGCAVSTAAGNAAGMDWRLTANSSDEPPAVSGLTLAECVGGSFGAGTAAGGAYPIGFDRIAGTTDIVELAFARELITGDVATDWNLFFVAESSLLGAVDVAGAGACSCIGQALVARSGSAARRYSRHHDLGLVAVGDGCWLADGLGCPSASRNAGLGPCNRR